MEQSRRLSGQQVTDPLLIAFLFQRDEPYVVELKAWNRAGGSVVSRSAPLLIAFLFQRAEPYVVELRAWNRAGGSVVSRSPTHC